MNNAYDAYVSALPDVKDISLTSSHRNAVRVLNIGRVQVGHIPRALAAKLAPLMDRRLITCEGVIHDGNCEILTSG